MALLATSPVATVAQQLILGQEEEREHGVGLDEVNRLVAGGTIRPLSDVVAVALRRCPGELIDADLRLRRGRYVYEVEILRRGQRAEVYVDAVTLEIPGGE